MNQLEKDQQDKTLVDWSNGEAQEVMESSTQSI
jgi:hypothetical protein